MNLKRRMGCGPWLIWLTLIVFGGEWLLLSAAITRLAPNHVPACVFSMIILTIVGGWVAVCVCVQRKSH